MSSLWPSGTGLGETIVAPDYSIVIVAADIIRDENLCGFIVGGR
jgi:hypothetical protein